MSGGLAEANVLSESGASYASAIQMDSAGDRVPSCTRWWCFLSWAMQLSRPLSGFLISTYPRTTTTSVLGPLDFF